MPTEPPPPLLRPALVALAALTALLGFAYPLALAGLGRLAWPRQAGGSLVVAGGRVHGSFLLGQAPGGSGAFWGRPSATLGADGRPSPCNPMAGRGSNLATSDPAWARAVAARVAALKAAHPGAADPVPVDLVTASGSGLDPHISPAAAAWQVPRVARARGLDEARVWALVAAATEGPQGGFLGEARVHVGRLNAALADLAPASAGSPPAAPSPRHAP